MGSEVVVGGGARGRGVDRMNACWAAACLLRQGRLGDEPAGMAATVDPGAVGCGDPGDGPA